MKTVKKFTVTVVKGLRVILAESKLPVLKEEFRQTESK